MPTNTTSAPPAPRPLAVGDRIHCYCGGYFGRDHYDCGVVEAIGADWMVARTVEDNKRAFAATGPRILTVLAEFRDNERCSWEGNWMNERGCFAADG